MLSGHCCICLATFGVYWYSKKKKKTHRRVGADVATQKIKDNVSIVRVPRKSALFKCRNASEVRLEKWYRAFIFRKIRTLNRVADYKNCRVTENELVQITFERFCFLIKYRICFLNNSYEIPMKLFIETLLAHFYTFITNGPNHCCFHNNFPKFSSSYMLRRHN